MDHRPDGRGLLRMHEAGIEHSVETWLGGELVGALRLALGALSSRVDVHAHNDASKVALATLVRQLELWGFGLVDCK